MAKRIRLEVVTPDRLVLSQDVDLVVAPGVEGEFGVLPGHSQFLSALKQGTVRYHIGDDVTRIPVTSGVAEVTPTQVTILVDALQEGDEASCQPGARLEAMSMTESSTLTISSQN